jgi:hypothetical protein
MHAFVVRGYDNQVHVIRHQAVREDFEAMELGMCVEEAQVRLWIALCQKDALPVVSTLCYMVGNARKYDSAPSWHGRTVVGFLQPR